MWTNFSHMAPFTAFVLLSALGHSFPLVTGRHGFWIPYRLKKGKKKKKGEKKATTEGVGGLKAAILGTAGPGWSLLPPVPFPVTFF